MLNRDVLKSLSKKLDKFVQNNVYIEESDYKLRNDPNFIEDSKQKINTFIIDYMTEKRETFADVLKDMGSKLGLIKKTGTKDSASDLYSLALRSKSNHSNIMKGDQPKKSTILGYGFALINENYRKEKLLKNPVLKNPDGTKMSNKDIMNKLFISLRDTFYTIGYNDFSDLVIIFFLEELKNSEFDITDVDYLLDHLKLPWLSERLLKDVDKPKKKLQTIDVFFEKIKSTCIDDASKNHITQVDKIRLLDDIKKRQDEYINYFTKIASGPRNDTNDVDEPIYPSTLVNAIYLPVFTYIDHNNEEKNNKKEI